MPRSVTCRSAGASTPATRIRGLDVVRLGLDGARWGFPLPAWLSAPGRGAVAGRGGDRAGRGGAPTPRGRSASCSGGEQQRLLIAQALVRRPRIAVARRAARQPRPPQPGRGRRARAADLPRREGVTVLLVAHDVNPILRYLDRVVYFAAGGAVEGSPREVIASETLSRLYGAPIEVLRASDGRLVVVGTPEPPAHCTTRRPRPCSIELAGLSWNPVSDVKQLTDSIRSWSTRSRLARSSP